MQTAYFNRFFLELPDECVSDCSGSGDQSENVKFWAKKIKRNENVSPSILSAELKEYGAWNSEERADDDKNWERIIWIAACNVSEEQFQKGN